MSMRLSAILCAGVFSLMGNTLAAQFNLQVLTCPDSSNGFRGIAALNDSMVWLASSKGQVWFYSLSGGWENRSPEAYGAIQWRDIEAFNDSTALILSAGSPGLVLRTEDRGLSWQESYRDDSPEIFFDAMDFWDAKRGIAFADAIENHLGLIETHDGGKTWFKWPDHLATQVWPKQGGFAASGTCIHTKGDSAWAIVLGGKQALYTESGETNHSVNLPLDEGQASKGAFSIDFKSNDTLIVVGGDYRADSLSNRSICISYNKGLNWFNPDFPDSITQRYWSCVQWQKQALFLSSRFGIALSHDNGRSWQFFDTGFYSIDGVWLSGPDGKLGRITVSYK